MLMKEVVKKPKMKKYFFVLPVIIAAIFLIWKLNCGTESDGIESFVLIDNVPYMVSGGTAYYWDDNNEEWVFYKEDVKELFPGELFCVLKEDGSLELCTDDLLDIKNMPLGMQFLINQASQLADISGNTPIRTLNKELGRENCWALCEDGSMLINPGEDYIPFEIQNETIKDISGDFILTGQGNVYQMENRNFGTFSYNQVSDDKFTAIAACDTAPRCVGINENNSAVMWSNLEPLELMDWKNVKEIAVGFNYCVGLTMNGKILYADYDKNREINVSKRLQGIRAEHITCCYETIAIIKNDSTVEMIDLSELN